MAAQIRLTKTRLEQQEKKEDVERKEDGKRAAALRNELTKLEAVKDVNITNRDALIDELYLRTVSRMPCEDERHEALEYSAPPRTWPRACANCFGSC